MKRHYICEYSNGYVRYPIGAWDEESHPYVTDEQWAEMLSGKEVQGYDGCFYSIDDDIDDDDLERW